MTPKTMDPFSVALKAAFGAGLVLGRSLVLVYSLGSAIVWILITIEVRAAIDWLRILR